jgi:hypothetical protein
MQLTVEPFVVAGGVAVSAWALAKEQILREFREACERSSKNHQCSWFVRKGSYIPTCEYCNSFWITLVALLFLQYQVLWDDWRGYVLAQFFTWSLAVAYMSIYQLLRVDIRHGQEKVETEKKAREALSDGKGAEVALPR